MKKYVVLIIALFVCCVAIFYISNNHGTSNYGKPPKIQIMANGEDIKYEIGLDTWNNIIYDIENPFVTLMKRQTKEEVIYVPIGSEIEITFLDNTPSVQELNEFVLLDDSNYNENTYIKSIPVEFNKKKLVFLLEELKNIGAYGITGQEELIRGYKLVCTKGNNKWAYVFLVSSEYK